MWFRPVMMGLSAILTSHSLGERDDYRKAPEIATKTGKINSYPWIQARTLNGIPVFFQGSLD